MSSSNLLKGYGVYYPTVEQEKRIIDTNELVSKKLEILNQVFTKETPKASSDGFVVGLNPKEVTLLDEEQSTEEIEATVEHLLANAKEEAKEIIAAAREQATMLVNDAVEQAQMSKNAIVDEARMLAYREGTNKAKDELELAKRELEEAKRQLKEKEKLLEEEYYKRVEEMEPQLVETISEIYEHIFHVDLKSHREVMLYLIASTLHNIEGGRDFLVHVSKDDYPYISMRKKQIINTTNSGVNIEIVEDMTLSKNECLIETDGGVFDCSLGVELKELQRKLELLSYNK